MLRKNLIFFAFLFLLGTSSAQELLHSSELHGPAVGYAGQKSDTYKVFATALKQGQRSKPLFQKCLKGGTPAAKLYGALGLYSLDPREGREALAQLRGDSNEVSMLKGCILERSTVGELAEKLLSKEKNSLDPEYFLPNKP